MVSMMMMMHLNNNNEKKTTNNNKREEKKTNWHDVLMFSSKMLLLSGWLAACCVLLMPHLNKYEDRAHTVCNIRDVKLITRKTKTKNCTRSQTPDEWIEREKKNSATRLHTGKTEKKIKCPIHLVDIEKSSFRKSKELKSLMCVLHHMLLCVFFTAAAATAVSLMALCLSNQCADRCMFTTMMF